MSEVIEPSEGMTILSAMNSILDAALGSNLAQNELDRAKDAFEYIKKELKMNQNESIILSILLNAGHNYELREIAHDLMVTNLTVMTLAKEFVHLSNRGYIAETSDATYVIPSDVQFALKHDMPYERPSYSCATDDDFFKLFSEIIDDPRATNYFTKVGMLDLLISENNTLPFVQKFNEVKFEDKRNGYIFMLAVSNLVKGDGNLDMDTIKDFFEGGGARRKITSGLLNGKNELLTKNLLEDGGIHFTGMKNYRLTYLARQEFLPSYEFQNIYSSNNRKDIIHWESLADIPLFFNKGEKEKMEQLADLLSEEKLNTIQKRLRDRGQQPGFACLLYGPAGTGKTQSVKWLSRITQRDIMKVDLAETRNCLVGETEKITRGIFTTYKRICNNSSRIPILLLNECDGMLSKRIENIRNSVDQMSNTVQNIILEQLENFEGILIATTNLTSTMGDDATFRRFLYKVKLSVPDVDTRAQIWSSKFPHLNVFEAKALASEFCLSGGLIENINRKAQVEEILYGKRVSLEQLRQFCQDELSVNGKRNWESVGFKVS